MTTTAAAAAKSARTGDDGWTNDDEMKTAVRAYKQDERNIYRGNEVKN